ncbi:MAG: family 43 glycosylhydrolase [Clostridia bacterium]|nr:family 43 glycosylhydrolase [Clostridia bacterium]
MITLQKNGTLWLDTDGNPIHAHGGHILQHEGYYYWYGEDRRENIYVSVYRSRDLVSWEFRGHCLTTESKTESYRVRTDLKLYQKTDDGIRKVNIERPKVLYNEKTKLFVMWAHYENGLDYHDARACIATCETPDGAFTYRGSFNPYGNMSRDCTLFVDEAGDAYFASASRDNADLAVYRLTEDYMNVDAQVNTLFQGEFREAPAYFYRPENQKYYLLSSYCTGWNPNQGKFSVSDSMDGRWSIPDLFGDETTYRSQPSFVLPYKKANGETEYLYFADRWGGGGELYFTSSYIVLPIRFRDNGDAYIDWCENCVIED